MWERDLSLYVWHEGSSDLPAKTGRQVESETTRGEGGLSYKTKSCTPVIQGWVVVTQLYRSVPTPTVFELAHHFAPNFLL